MKKKIDKTYLFIEKKIDPRKNGELKKWNSARITVDLKFGSVFQRVSILGAFKATMNSLEAFYILRHKKNSIKFEIK